MGRGLVEGEAPSRMGTEHFVAIFPQIFISKRGNQNGLMIVTS